MMKLGTETVCLSLSLGTGSSFSLNTVLLLPSFTQHLKCKRACKWAHKHMIVRATHAHVCLRAFLCFYMIHISWHDVRKKKKQSNSPLKDVTTSWFSLGSWGSILNHRGNHASSLHDAALLQLSAVEKREWEEREGDKARVGGWA